VRGAKPSGGCWLWQEPELLELPEHIDDIPVLGQLAVLHSPDLDAGGSIRSPRCRHAEDRSDVRPGLRPAKDDLVSLFNQVVDRGTSEVRPKKFRLLARITEVDDREFQESYGRCSLWARRHDKSPEVNYVPPQISEMEQELALVKSWFERVRKYAE